MISPTRTDKSQFHPYFSLFIPESLQPKRSSRTEELLLSNKPPLEFERQDFLEIAARGPQTLDEFDEKIAAARQLLDFLVSERDQAVSNISDAKSLLHPVRRLPDDVLRAVFRACTKSADLAFDWLVIFSEPKIDIESIQPNQSPWTVSCVCRQWRTVAIHTGEFWSFIELDLDQRYRNKELAKNRVFRLGLSLFRANGHDLFIRLHGKKIVPDVSPILQVLLPTAPYWKRLSVSLPLSSFRHFSVCKGYLNRLDTLYIGSIESEIDAFHTDAFQLAPSLKVLGTYKDRPFMAHFSVPSSGITTFRSQGPNMHTYESLKRLPRVQRLTSLCCQSGLVDEAAEPISLHSVTFLHLLGLSSGPLSIANMYSHLILPSLRQLEITVFGSEPPDEISFPVVTNPESCPIKTLCIHLHRLSQEACTQLGDELIKFLRRTPKLNGLHIMADPETRLPDQWLHSLVYIPGQDAIAPCLSLLSIPRGRITAGGLDCLVNVIESRRRKDVDSSDGKHCALLKGVILGPEPVEFDDEELSARWMALCAGGLIVTYRKK
ncbi:hypothetical protein EV421DRAFT_928847 [Armillaria borealis]|uniref:F-box domain-containing protein n=1 Tax=Armillaria borealis TaxID=47425 RepID=A0AA39JBJ1_9AGAR|nr:hypothetical protein EV421DRAFT_928847 [Armillaria borealis]